MLNLRTRILSSNVFFGSMLASAIIVGSLVINPYWVFSEPNGHVDPWFYYGFMIDFKRAMTLEAGNWYMGSRLAWILPGVLVNSLLKPQAAYLLLQLSMYFAFILGNFLLLRRFLGLAASTFGTILISTSTIVLTVFSWPFVQAPALTYMVFAILSARVGTERRSQLLLFLSGFLCVLSFSCQPAVGVLIPLLLLVGGRKPKPREAIGWLCGAGASLLCLSLIYSYYTGKLWLWSTSLTCINSLVQTSQPMLPKDVIPGPYIALWVSLLVFSLFDLLKSEVKSYRLFISMLFYPSLTFLILWYFQLPTLDYYYLVFILLPVFWYVAFLFERKIDRLNGRQKLIVLSTTFFLGMATFSSFFYKVNIPVDLKKTTGIVASILVLVPCLHFLLNKRIHLVFVVGSICVLGFANISSSPWPWKYGSQLGIEKANTLDLVVEAHNIVRQHTSGDPNSTFFWGMASEELNLFWRDRLLSASVDIPIPKNISSPFSHAIVMSFYPKNAVPSFPYLASWSEYLLRSSTELVLISKKPIDYNIVAKTLDAYGFRLSEEKEKIFLGQGENILYLSFYKYRVKD